MTLYTSIKKRLKRSQRFMSSRLKLHRDFRALIFALSPVLVAKYNYLSQRWRLPNLEKPRTFDEKLLWLMLYWRHPLKARCADKYAVRGYVEQNGLPDILTPLIGVYESTEEIQLSALPNQFALKCTHGCGFNILCKAKDAFDWENARRRLKQWMSIDIGKVNGEIHYSEIKPRIVCEYYLRGEGESVPNDYKMFCFGGKVHCTMTCTGRYSSEGAQFDFYDIGWKNKLPYSKTSLVANRNIPAPKCYARMVEAAKVLSKPFPFVRIDFYDIDGKAVLGEMTFTPNGCVDTDYTDLAQEELGSLITLPKQLL